MTIPEIVSEAQAINTESIEIVDQLSIILDKAKDVVARGTALTNVISAIGGDVPPTPETIKEIDVVNTDGTTEKFVHETPAEETPAE